MEVNPNNELFRKARRKARDIRGFYIHCLCYATIIPLLIVVNLVFVPDFYWFPFSMLGWGTGLLFHALSVYDIAPFFGKRWEEKKIKEFMDRDRADKTKN